MRRGPSIRYQLLIANAFILLVPIFAAAFLHLWDGHLVRLTEQQLIAEASLIGEAWRERLWEVEGKIPESKRAPFTPITPLLPLNYRLEPPVGPVTRFAQDRGGPEWLAGVRVQPLLERAQLTNLSGVRVLGKHGCVVATTGSDLGAYLEFLPEVKEALAGRYAALTRAWVSNSASSEGRFTPGGLVRVFAAMPVLEDGAVIGAVYLSRTASSPLEAVWNLRLPVLAGLALCTSLTLIVSFFFSRRIVRPVQTITRAADAVARGEAASALLPTGSVPREVATLAVALQRMTAQLTDRAAYIEQFSATMSHELKTPITGIRGAVELLREGWDEMDRTQRQRFLANVDADAERMERLVKRLLQLARIQNSGEGSEVIDIPSFLDRLSRRYGETVQLDLREAPATLVMNPDHLESALGNLIDNAVRHGGGSPIEVTAKKHAGRQVAFVVRDHGCGISDGNRQRIFERFFTTERDHGGTGLGLAIVKAVAETRGGSVSFETGAAGTTFTLVV